jgi:Rrf2 family protein
MLLSTKGRYGIRAMYDLAVKQSDGPQPVKAISERQGIPEAYLEQLIAPRRRAGLVNSQRGSSGGYSLSLTPNDISIGTILRSLEGPMAPAMCVLEEETCELSGGCAMHKLWQRMFDGVNDLFDSITLQQMLEDSDGKEICQC